MNLLKIIKNIRKQVASLQILGKVSGSMPYLFPKKFDLQRKNLGDFTEFHLPITLLTYFEYGMTW